MQNELPNYKPLADRTNRLDVLRKQETLPPYIGFSRNIRDHLQNFVEEKGWPKFPEGIEKVEDLFEAARSLVTKTWQEQVIGTMAERCQKWLATIPDTKENKNLISFLSDKDRFEEIFSSRHFWVLGSLRRLNPEAWRSILLASSERQLAAVAVLDHWIGEIPDDVVGKLGMGKVELKLMVDLAGILGKWFDQTYIKQVELADAPGGSEKTPLQGQKGTEYLYDYLIDEKEIKKAPYLDIFSYEWPKVAKRLEALSQRTQRLIQSGELPKTYEQLPAFLTQMARTYGSGETDLKLLSEKWRSLYAKAYDLVKSGCPITIIPQGSPLVAEAAMKVDVEIRMGITTPGIKGLGDLCLPLKKEAEALNERYQSSLAKVREVPEIAISYQAFGFGPNLFAMTRGQSFEGFIVSHANETEAVALARIPPVIAEIFGEKVDLDELKKSANLLMAAHEDGHAVLHYDDQKVVDRTGVSPAKSAIEELKAETVGVKLFLNCWQNREIEVELRTYFLSIVAGNLNLLKGLALGEKIEYSPYSLMAITIIDRLLAAKIIVPEGERYRLGDPVRGLEVIGEIADEILKIYSDDMTTPDKVKEYVDKLRDLNDKDEMQNFYRRLNK